MIAEPLKRVLEATGYLEDGQPAPGVRVDADARMARHRRNFVPDALWQSPSSLTVYFKYQANSPEADEVARWRQEIWNEGFAPLLWVISPERIEVYNGFGRPQKERDAEQNRLKTFRAIADGLQRLDEFAGRLAMETGQFWRNADAIDRKSGVDRQLLRDLSNLERDLVAVDLERKVAQALIGRTIFTQYLVDRSVITEDLLIETCGPSSLPAVLRNAPAAKRLFCWLITMFNGDMFPPDSAGGPIQQRHLHRMADFLEAVDPDTGQGSLFPYQFDVIPVELISSIYEQFVHAKENRADQEGDVSGVHYTRIPVVSLILDEVMDEITGNESVLDLTCGSGVLLVEAFRRLVLKKSRGKVTRAIVREALHEQIFGVDSSPAAIRVAAFSLYLAALELDPNPEPPEALTFAPLIGRNLFIGDAKQVDLRGVARGVNGNGFDIVVGNPPWTYKGAAGTLARREFKRLKAMQPRGEGLDFVYRAMDFAHQSTRYGLVLDALPFFAASRTGSGTVLDLLGKLKPMTLVNLAGHTSWLFGTASKPAMILLARTRSVAPNLLTVVNVPWSPSAQRSHTFEITPTDVLKINIESIVDHPQLLKAAAVGQQSDLFLLQGLRERLSTLGEWANSIGSAWRDGLILGKPERRSRSAAHLSGLELLETGDMRRFCVPLHLAIFNEPLAQWPRARETYKAPLLLVKEFLPGRPRPLAALATRDLVYTDAFFGAALGNGREDAGWLLSGILSSSFAAWFFLMTAAEFGVWKRRLLTSDVGRIPVPPPDLAKQTPAGRRLIEIVKSSAGGADSEIGWAALDDAVCDLYDLDPAARIVIADGLERASWQWESGRTRSVAPANLAQIKQYAQIFADRLQEWLKASDTRHIRAEIFEFRQNVPLRICRFVLQRGGGATELVTLKPQGDLQSVIRTIELRMDMRLGRALVGRRELRIHGDDEVVVIKPAASRHWMKSRALQDANAVLIESFTGAAA